MRRGRRRSSYDPLQPVDAATWLVVHDAASVLLVATRLEPRIDARARLDQAEAEWTAAGWLVEPRTPVCSSFFCTKAGERREVGIARRDPDGPQIDEGRVSAATWPLK